MNSSCRGYRNEFLVWRLQKWSPLKRGYQKWIPLKRGDKIEVEVSLAVMDRKCPRLVVSFADWSPVSTCDSREKSDPCNSGWQYPVQWLTETSLSLKLVECLSWTDPPWKHETSWRQLFQFFESFFLFFFILWWQLCKRRKCHDEDGMLLLRCATSRGELQRSL